MEDLNNMTQTPEETAQNLSALADRLAEMDKAEGVFGEAVTDEELEDVAGGHRPINPTFAPTGKECPLCHFSYEHGDTPSVKCLADYPPQLCYFLSKDRGP